MQRTLKQFLFPCTLIASILLGGMTGYYLGADALLLKPLGDIFLSLIFSAITPLVFFSVSSAMTRAGSFAVLGRLFFYIPVVFVATSLVAAIFSIASVSIFPPLTKTSLISSSSLSSSINNTVDMGVVASLFPHVNMLYLIIVSILFGFVASLFKSRREVKRLIHFLHAGEDVFMRVFSIIMYYAPIGFFAYFAVIISQLGPSVLENYTRISIIYYLTGTLYFFAAYTAYAYLAGNKRAVKLFWKNIFLPATTAIATCSSAASIPAGLAAAKEMQIPPAIYEAVIPLGSIIHKDGSVIGGIFKIAFLFGIFHLSFSGVSVLLTAIGVSLLVGTVMGAIPSGGMLGELLILSVYGFPPSWLMAIAAFSLIIDPLATMISVTGNSASAMLIARLTMGDVYHPDL